MTPWKTKSGKGSRASVIEILPMFTKISHIGIAVFSINEALKFYRDRLGLAVSRIEEVEQEGVRVAMLPVGDTRIELLEPLDDKSPLYKTLKKRGEGVHHIAFHADDLAAEIEKLSDDGIPILGEIRTGAEGALIAFLHPKEAHGVLLELCQEKI